MSIKPGCFYNSYHAVPEISRQLRSGKINAKKKNETKKGVKQTENIPPFGVVNVSVYGKRGHG